eukprot:CAMPEP_0171333688 /NCGR_PEP_ID=MMETSP0878-20121228/4156_1 /TAXON_ID=67004 /ORGANISM="Thalassiosira weissflogii, Strain CCMP1336" /LENGTH=546 /DNA_ID=CAMNT_0011834657 /DNA_START=113 /DNA_END=1753 /DNA_ORIENTATION=+
MGIIKFARKLTSAVSSNSPRGRGKGRKKISANDAANRVITLKARISTHEGRKRSLEEENENLTQEIIAKRRTDENGAISALKRKKINQIEVDKISNILTTLHILITRLESAVQNAETFEAINAGTNVMTNIATMIGIEDVDDLMDNLNEAMDLTDEVSDGLAHPLDPLTLDRDELLAELHAMHAEDVEIELLREPRSASSSSRDSQSKSASTLQTTEFPSILLNHISIVYEDNNERVTSDVKTFLQSEIGRSFGLTTEPYVLDNGTFTRPVVMLSGILPVFYQGEQYNIPVDNYLPPRYPRDAPVVFVRPVAGMAIYQGHRHVGLDGRVYMPYLSEWASETHDLSALAIMISSLFGDDPPCYTIESEEEIEQRRLGIEREIEEANLAAEVARQAEEAESRMKAENAPGSDELVEDISTQPSYAKTQDEMKVDSLEAETENRMKRGVKGMEKGVEFNDDLSVQSFSSQFQEETKVDSSEQENINAAVESLLRRRGMQTKESKRGVYKKAAGVATSGLEESSPSKAMKVEFTMTMNFKGGTSSCSLEN